MLDLGEEDGRYVPSSILSKKIKEFHDNSKELLPFLAQNTKFHEIQTDCEIGKSLECIFRMTEPCVINVRPGKAATLQQEIIRNLSDNHDFINLDVKALQTAEMERKTVIGEEYIKLLKQDKSVPASLICKMLKRIIYCGQTKLNKFILSNFPEEIDQVKELEAHVVKLAAIIYPSGSSAFVELSNQELQSFNIESLFQKDFRLKTMNEWSFQLFNEKLGNKVEFGVVSGKPGSGKTQACTILEKQHGFTAINMQTISDQCKATLGTEDEPFEGDVPLADVEKAICKMINDAKSAGGRCKFVFDSFLHATEEEFMTFVGQFGCPNFILFLTCDEKTVGERWCKKNEAEDVPEDVTEEFKTQSAANSARREKLTEIFTALKVEICCTDTSKIASVESFTKDLNNKFSSKVVLVNHEQTIGVDNTCSNLAIKYNMIYISAYQCIKHHIENKTDWGLKLCANRKEKGVVLEKVDDFMEQLYSPVHFDMSIIMQLMKETISSKTTNQKFVIIEGLCNSLKLSDVENQLELRLMDEFFNIEATLGEVKAIIGLQYNEEQEYVREDEIEYEQFPEAPVEEVKEKKEGEEDEEEAPVEEEDDGEKKAPAFKKEEYQWTISNRKPKNLPQLYQGCKGINTLHECKTSDMFGVTKEEQISKSMDDFFNRLHEPDNSDKYLYQQIIFTQK